MGQFLLMESRPLGTADGAKKPHAKTKTGDSSVDAVPRIFGAPRKSRAFWAAADTEFGAARKKKKCKNGN